MDVIESALLTRGPTTYGHLLGTPGIDDETRAIISAFAYGSIADLPPATFEKLPTLAADNLRAISVIHLVTSHGRTLSYDVIRGSLRLADDAAAERAVLHGVATELYDATLDPTRRTISVTNWTARETNREQISEIEEALAAFIGNSDTILVEAERKAVEEDDKTEEAKNAKERTEEAIKQARDRMEDEMKNRGSKPNMMAEAFGIRGQAGGATTPKNKTIRGRGLFK